MTIYAFTHEQKFRVIDGIPALVRTIAETKWNISEIKSRYDALSKRLYRKEMLIKTIK